MSEEITERTMGNSFTWVNNIILDQYLPLMGPHEFLIYITLARYTNKTHQTAWPCVKTICQKTGICERTVQVHLKHLVEIGLLHAEIRDGLSTRYHLLAPSPVIVLQSDTPTTTDVPPSDIDGGGTSIVEGGATDVTGGGVLDAPKVYIISRKIGSRNNKYYMCDEAKNASSRGAAQNAAHDEQEEHSSLKAENSDTRDIDTKRDAVDILRVSNQPSSLTVPAPVLAANEAIAQPLTATMPVKPSKPAKPRKPIILRAKPECATAMLAREYFQAAKLPYTLGEFRRAQHEFKELINPPPEFRSFDPEVIRDCIRTLAEHGVKMTSPGIVAKVIVAFVADEEPFPSKYYEPKTQRKPKWEREKLAKYALLSGLPGKPYTEPSREVFRGHTGPNARTTAQGDKSVKPGIQSAVAASSKTDTTAVF